MELPEVEVMRRDLERDVGGKKIKDAEVKSSNNLCERGLSGVQLVIADDHRGLAGAVRLHLPEAKQQRCTVHLERNILAKTPQRLRGRVAKQLRAIFTAASVAEAKQQLHAFATGLGRQLPEALRCLEGGFAAATQFYAFPRQHWIRIRSTNGLVRLHGRSSAAPAASALSRTATALCA